jgi:hypothetical protein
MRLKEEDSKVENRVTTNRFMNLHIHSFPLHLSDFIGYLKLAPGIVKTK